MQTNVGRRVSTMTSESRGRPVRSRLPRTCPPERIAFLPSVTAALARRGRRLPLRLEAQDLREWVRQGKAPLSIVLVADVSASSAWFLKPAERMLSLLYRDAYRSRDNLGLVAIQDGRVEVLHHPSRNLQAVLGTLTRLVPSGLTPLAEALERTLELIQRQRRRESGTNPLAILISDCHPEPIRERTEDLLDTVEYRQALLVARQYRRARVPILVLNPGHEKLSGGRLWWGTQLGMRIASVSGGRYHGITSERVTDPDPLGPGARVFHDIDEGTASIRRVLVEFQGRPIDSML